MKKMVVDQSQNEERLLQILRDFLLEKDATRAAKRVSIKAQFEYDLGLDSLDRVEFFHRVEESFDCQFPASVFAEALNIIDLLNIIQATQPLTQEKAKRRVITPPLSPIQSLHANTLVDCLMNHVEQTPTTPHIIYQADDGIETIITYGSLYDAAVETAKGLQERGLKPQDTVAIMLPTCEDFFYAFFGVLLAGGIPVPIYPPFRPNLLEEYVQREANILRNAGVKFLITFPEAETLSHIIQGFIPSMKSVVTVKSLRNSTTPLLPLTILPSDPAFIQYTSGSTGNPKGVLLNHANIIANLTAVGEAIQVTTNDRVVSWLPLYHDMGLIGCWFGSLYFGLPLTILSPLTFLTRPERWLWALHAHQATLTAAPNFAFELCIRKVKESSIEGLDLSSLRLIFNGAEPVQAKTLRRFIEKFKPYGLKPSSVFPVYGLAESTVALSFPSLNRSEPYIDLIQRGPFEKKGLAVKAEHLDHDALEIVSCGQAIPGHDIKIVDEKGNTLPERTVGALWFRGPSSMQEYYHSLEATEAIRHGDWLDSGDNAYIAQGEIFITGRVKDMIIKAGRNIYPQDIESITANIPGIRKGCVIAFGVTHSTQGTEKLVIVAETVERDKTAQEEILQHINARIVTDLGLPADEIILVPPGTIPKTSSGKLQRSACKAAYLQKQLTTKRLPVWLQVSKLFVLSKIQPLKSLLNQGARFLFTFYALLLFLVFSLPALLSIGLSPRPIAQKLSRFWIRSYFLLAGWWFKVEGIENLTKIHPVIYVVNHASYFDSLLLIALLPPGVAVVGKRELITSSLMRWLITKLDHLTVERQDVSQSLLDLAVMEERIQKSQSLVIFPEGTFTYIAGLRPFKLGAFKLAIETNTLVCPIALKGTRQILPDGSYLLRPSKITITICPPLAPQNKEWSEVLRLRSLARDAIARYCGEPIFNID